MKYKVLRQFVERNGKNYNAGDEIDLVDVVAKFYLERGLIKSVEPNLNKKISAINKVETKPKRKK